MFNNFEFKHRSCTCMPQHSCCHRLTTLLFSTFEKCICGTLYVYKQWHDRLLLNSDDDVDGQLGNIIHETARFSGMLSCLKRLVLGKRFLRVHSSTLAAVRAVQPRPRHFRCRRIPSAWIGKYAEYLCVQVWQSTPLQLLVEFSIGMI